MNPQDEWETISGGLGDIDEWETISAPIQVNQRPPQKTYQDEPSVVGGALDSWNEWNRKHTAYDFNPAAESLAKKTEQGMNPSFAHGLLAGLPFGFGSYLESLAGPPSLQDIAAGKKKQWQGPQDIVASGIRGAGEFATQMAEPQNLVPTVLSLGAYPAAKFGLQGLTKGAIWGARALSAPVAAGGVMHGYDELTNDKPWDLNKMGRLGMAGFEAGMGALGTFEPMPRVRPRAAPAAATATSAIGPNSAAIEPWVTKSGHTASLPPEALQQPSLPGAGAEPTRGIAPETIYDPTPPQVDPSDARLRAMSGIDQTTQQRIFELEVQKSIATREGDWAEVAAIDEAMLKARTDASVARRNWTPPEAPPEAPNPVFPEMEGTQPDIPFDLYRNQGRFVRGADVSPEMRQGVLGPEVGELPTPATTPTQAPRTVGNTPSPEANPNGLDVVTVNPTDAGTVGELRAQGYVPWKDHLDNGFPMMIRHEPLPAGDVPAATPTATPTPTAAAPSPAGSPARVPINPDGSFTVPKERLTTRFINQAREQGIEMFGRDEAGNGFFRRLLKDEEGSIDPRMFNPMNWLQSPAERGGGGGRPPVTQEALERMRNIARGVADDTPSLSAMEQFRSQDESLIRGAIRPSSLRTMAEGYQESARTSDLIGDSAGAAYYRSLGDMAQARLDEVNARLGRPDTPIMDQAADSTTGQIAPQTTSSLEPNRAYQEDLIRTTTNPEELRDILDGYLDEIRMHSQAGNSANVDYYSSLANQAEAGLRELASTGNRPQTMGSRMRAAVEARRPLSLDEQLAAAQISQNEYNIRTNNDPSELTQMEYHWQGRLASAGYNLHEDGRNYANHMLRLINERRRELEGMNQWVPENQAPFTATPSRATGPDQRVRQRALFSGIPERSLPEPVEDIAGLRPRNMFPEMGNQDILPGMGIEGEPYLPFGEAGLRENAPQAPSPDEVRLQRQHDELMAQPNMRHPSTEPTQIPLNAAISNARRFADLNEEQLKLLRETKGETEISRDIHKSGSAEAQSWDYFAKSNLAGAGINRTKIGLSVEEGRPGSADYAYSITFRDENGKPMAVAHLERNDYTGSDVLDIPILASDMTLPKMTRARAVKAVLDKATELGAAGTAGGTSAFSRDLAAGRLKLHEAGKRGKYGLGREPEVGGPLQGPEVSPELRVQQAQEGEGFISRLLRDESGFIDVEEMNKVAARFKSTLGKKWGTMMELLRTHNAPDEAYRELMPNSTRPLGTNETWQGRVQKGIDFFESEAKRLAKDDTGATSPTDMAKELERLFTQSGSGQPPVPPTATGSVPPGGGGVPPDNAAWLQNWADKPSRERSYFRNLWDLTRGITTTGDWSAPFRQGLPLIHTAAWWNSWKQMRLAFGDADAFKKTLSDIRERPLFKRDFDTDTMKEVKSTAEEAGLAIMDVNAPMTRREEGLASKWVENGQMFGKDNAFQRAYEKFPGEVAAKSNRAYTAYLNQLRADTFEGLVNDARKAFNADLKAGNKSGALDPDTDMTFLKEIADYVNTATGRGPLRMQLPTLTGPSKWSTTSIMGKEISLPFKERSAERAGHVLTEALFSPRLFASRMRMLNPATYMMATPFVRKQYLNSFLATAGAWTTVSGLAAMGGADVSLDPSSSDFGKIKIGNTRLDPAGGFQQFVVAGYRLLSGKYRSSGTGKEFELGQGYRTPSRREIGQRFMVNKAHPALKFGYDILDATSNQPFHVADRTAQLFVPLIAQDLIELAKEDPRLLPLLGPVSVGMGTQTYDKGETKGKLVPESMDWVFGGGAPQNELPDWMNDIVD